MHETPESGNTAKDNYYGERYAFAYTGNYNFNLDNSLVFGVERDDQIGYNKDLTGIEKESYYTTSSYFDFQRGFQIICTQPTVQDLMITLWLAMRNS